MMRRALLLLACAACLLPMPPEPAQLPDLPPSILGGGVRPPAGRVLTQPLGDLVVPVQLVDPSVSFEWKLYVDYDTGVLPSDPEGLAGLVAQDTVLPDGERVREIRIPLSQVSDRIGLSANGCSVIEVIVARSFLGRRARDGHTPAPPGGDTITWFYNPKGITEGCKVQDVPTQPVDAGGQ
jgi:hypothetical protein